MTLFPPCSLGQNSIFCMSSHQTPRPRPSSDHASEKSILKEVEDMKVGATTGHPARAEVNYARAGRVHPKKDRRLPTPLGLVGPSHWSEGG